MDKEKAKKILRFLDYLRALIIINYIYRNSVLRVMPMTCRVAPILSLE